MTNGVDIESHFLSPVHLALINESADEADFKQLIKEATDEVHDDLVSRIVNGRIDIARKTGTYNQLDHGKLAVTAPKDLATQPDRYRHGKTLLKQVRTKYKAKTGANLVDFRSSSALRNPELETIAKKVFGGTKVSS